MKLNKKIIPLLIAIGFSSGIEVAQAQGYDYEAVEYPGASQTQLWGINEQGTAVGTALIEPHWVSFEFDIKTRRFSNVAPVAGYDDTFILGISESGNLVGRVQSGAPDENGLIHTRGLFIDQNRSTIVFDHPAAHTATSIRAANNAGLIAGYRDFLLTVRYPTEWSLPPLNFQVLAGFSYDLKTGKFTDLVPSYRTIPHQINAKGEIVGSARLRLFSCGEDLNCEADGVPWVEPADPCVGQIDFQPGVSRQYGWLRSAAGDIKFFAVNGWPTYARGISASGTTAGWYLSFDSESGAIAVKGFITEVGAAACQSIPAAEENQIQFPGSPFTYVEGITNSGTLIGHYFDDAGIVSTGFVARPR